MVRPEKASRITGQQQPSGLDSILPLCSKVLPVGEADPRLMGFFSPVP